MLLGSSFSVGAHSSSQPIFFFEVKKKYYPISIKVEAIGERPDVSTDNREDDPNNGKYIEDQSKTDKMDTENNIPKGYPPSASNTSKASKSGNSNAPDRKSCGEGVDDDAPDPACNLSSTIPWYLTSSSKNIMGWLVAENLDEEKCYNF
jgi:hypothetical protein